MQKKNKIRLWLRRIHRDAGYLVVGVTLVYALSGIFLHHKMGVRTATDQIQLAQYLSPQELKELWTSSTSQKAISYSEDKSETIHFYFPGGMGEYHKISGQTTYETYKDRPVIKFMSQLHENQVKGWSYVADIYAGILIFLALSGLFMVPGKNGFMRRGIWWFVAGIVLVLVFAAV